MPAKWHQWMPFNIEKFWSSPSVQAMAHAAQIGYLRLLGAQWQSEEGSISSDAFDLSEQSGLGDELWALHGPRILRKFVTLPDGRLRNQTNYQEWCAAKKIFDSKYTAPEDLHRKRSDAGRKGNAVRWGSDKGDRKCDNNSSHKDRNGSPTGTGTTTSTEKQKYSTASDEVLPEQLAKEVMRSAKLSADSVFTAVYDQAKLETTSGGFTMDEANVLLKQMVDSWLLYTASTAKLQIIRKAADFYAEGMWRDPQTWPWKEGSRPDGNKRSSPTSDRVNANRTALADAARRAGIAVAIRSDGGEVSPSGFDGRAGGVSAGLHRAGAEVRDRSSPGSAARAAADVEILPPAK